MTQKLDIFVPLEDNIKVQVLQLENNELRRKKYKLIYYVKPVLDEDEIKSSGFLSLKLLSYSNH